MKFHKAQGFKKLQAEWYKKLKNSGFKDIESKNESKKDRIRPQEFTVDHAKIEYFQRCEEYLGQNQISDSLDLFIFQNHCDGKSNRTISEILPQYAFEALTPRAVDKRLQRLLAAANIEPIEFGRS